MSPDEFQLFGRNDAEALADVVEWREWHQLLARRDRYAHDQLPTLFENRPFQESNGALMAKPDQVDYWKWNGHLVRYFKWEGASGQGAGPKQPPLLFVHGFAASADQFSRCAHELRRIAKELGIDAPECWAFDLQGFGHSEAPCVSYTQHLWEAQVVDFVVDVMRPTKGVVLIGNSIGGGIAAGAAANLKSLCRGLVLTNSAGVLKDPLEMDQESNFSSSIGDATLRGELSPYSPLPFGGSTMLEIFGRTVITLLRPRIPSLLSSYYPVNALNADNEQAWRIARDASDPGAAGVIAAGQKLPPQRTLNEVLDFQTGFAGPCLIPQGILDPLAGAARTQSRADTFEQLRDGVTVVRLSAGHCPHDEVPDQFAQEILSWLKTERLEE